MAFSNFVKFFDFSAVRVPIMYEGKTIYKSTGAGFIYLLALLLSSVFFWLSFADFLLYKKYSLQNYEENVGSQIKINLKDSKYGLLFGVILNKTEPFLKAYEYLDLIVYQNKSSFESFEENQIPNSFCTYDDLDYLPQDIKDSVISNFKYQNLFCLNGQDFNIGGDFITEGEESLTIELKIKESFKTTDEAEKAKTFFQENYLSLVLLKKDFFLDPNNRMDPINYYIASNFFEIDYFLSNSVQINHMQNVFFDDQGLFSSSKEEFKNLSIKNVETNLKTRNIDLSSKYYNSSLLKIQINSSNFRTTMTRSYLKANEFLSETTVIISNVFFVINTIVRFVNEQKLKSIMAALFMHEPKIKLVRQLINNSASQVIPFSRSNQKSKKIEEKKKIWSCCSRKENKMLKLWKEKALQSFDIEEIMIRLQKIDLIENVLFGEKFENVMLVCSKPFLSERPETARTEISVDKLEVERIELEGEISSIWMNRLNAKLQKKYELFN